MAATMADSRDVSTVGTMAASLVANSVVPRDVP